jgi:8-oxo-dGTP diphosphatase
MLAVTLLVTTAQRPVFSSATLDNDTRIAITTNATIKPYSIAVAPRVFRSSLLKKVPRIDFPPERTVRWVAFWQRSPNEKLMRRAPLEKKPTFVPVVAAAIRDGEGRLLLQQGLPHKRHAGLWEFPGGKVENGETPRFALCREVAEELGIELVEAALRPLGFAEEAGIGDESALVLFLYTSSQWHGEPEAREGQGWGWFTPAEAARLPMPAMDRALLAQVLASPPG